MRTNPLILTLVLIGLFLLALGGGFLAGQIFFKPPPTGTTQPTPIPSPGTSVVSSPSPLLTPGALPSVVEETPTPSPSPTPTVTTTRRVPTSPRPTPTPSPVASATPRSTALYRVQAGAFLKRENAEDRVTQLKGEGFDAYIVRSGNLYKVQVGAFARREDAEALAAQLRAIGYETIIVQQ